MRTVHTFPFKVGWLVMRSTVKLRQPLNLALAAGLSKLAPSLSMLKVTLATGESAVARIVDSVPKIEVDINILAGNMYQIIGHDINENFEQ